MGGRIFNDTTNIYQDQAKILFDYYRSAAEKIVDEEKSIEGKLTEAKYQIELYQEDLKKAKQQRTIGWVLCWTIIGLIFAILGVSKVKKFKGMIGEKNQEIEDLETAYANIFRDYHVTKMGIAYVPVAKRVAYEGKSFVVDQTGVTKNEQFKLQIIRQNDLLNESVKDLRQLSKSAPIVETSSQPEVIDTGEYSKSIQNIRFNDYFGKMDRTLRAISYGLNDIDEYNVELPVVFPGTEYAEFLEAHATSDIEGSPVFDVFDIEQFDSDIEKFNKLNETRKALSTQSEQVDAVLKTLMSDMAGAVQATSAKKVASAGSLVDYSNKILLNILKSPYDFYSPVLEAEEIERIRTETFDYEAVDHGYKPFNLRDSSKVRFDISSMCWVADDGSRTTAPFGVNQIQYEIIAPIVTNLLKDTRKDRLDIYNHIKDQKLSYLNKWHQDTEDFYGRNRAEAADIINLMRSTLSEYSAAYNTLEAYKKTEESMQSQQTLASAVTEAKDNSAEVLAGYQAQAQQVSQTQKEFSEYMERLHEDIDARAEKFGYIEYYDASLRDRRSKEVAQAVQDVGSLDSRRRILAEVSPLLARTSELLPEPNIEQEAYESAGINLNSLVHEALEEIDAVERAAASREHVTEVETKKSFEDEETRSEGDGNANSAVIGPDAEEPNDVTYEQNQEQGEKDASVSVEKDVLAEDSEESKEQ